MGRYVPKHRKRRQVAARRAMAHAGALFVGGAVLLSGAYGSGPVLLSAAPLTLSAEEAPVADDPGFPSVPAPKTPAAAATSIPSPTTSSADPAFVDISAIGSTSTIERLGTLLDGARPHHRHRRPAERDPRSFRHPHALSHRALCTEAPARRRLSGHAGRRGGSCRGCRRPPGPPTTAIPPGAGARPPHKGLEASARSAR